MTTALQRNARKRSATAQAFPLMARMAPAFDDAKPPIAPELRKHFEAGFLNAVNEIYGAASKSLDDLSGDKGKAHDAGWLAAKTIHEQMKGKANG